MVCAHPALQERNGFLYCFRILQTGLSSSNCGSQETEHLQRSDPSPLNTRNAQNCSSLVANCKLIDCKLWSPFLKGPLFSLRIYFPQSIFVRVLPHCHLANVLCYGQLREISNTNCQCLICPATRSKQGWQCIASTAVQHSPTHHSRVMAKLCFPLQRTWGAASDTKHSLKTAVTWQLQSLT